MGCKTENPTRMDVEGGAGADQRPRREKTVPFASRGSSGGWGEELAWLSIPRPSHSWGRLWAWLFPARCLVPALRCPGLCTVTEVPPEVENSGPTKRKREDDGE